MALSDLLQQACFQCKPLKRPHCLLIIGWVIFLASVTVSSVRMSMFRQQPALIKRLAGARALQEWRKSKIMKPNGYELILSIA